MSRDDLQGAGIGHEYFSSVTNSYGRVPCCSCGWIGNVHPAPVTHEKVDGRRRKQPKQLHEVAAQAAREEWYTHCQGADMVRAAVVAAAVPNLADLAFRRRHPSAW